MSEDFKKRFAEMQARVANEKMRERLSSPGVGEQLSIRVGANDGLVTVTLGASVDSFAIPPTQARQWAIVLIEQAFIAEQKARAGEPS